MVDPGRVPSSGGERAGLTASSQIKKAPASRWSFGWSRNFWAWPLPLADAVVSYYQIIANAAAPVR